jgi:hypothetical protein
VLLGDLLISRVRAGDVHYLERPPPAPKVQAVNLYLVQMKHETQRICLATPFQLSIISLTAGNNAVLMFSKPVAECLFGMHTHL